MKKRRIMIKFKLFFKTFLLLLTAFIVAPAIAVFYPESEYKITASDGASGHRFGAVSIDGTRMAVGAPAANLGGNGYQGAVYIYDFDGTSWNQTAKITASDASTNDFFGISVSLDGDRVAVGASGDDNSQGAVYIYDFDNTSWTQTTKFTGHDTEINDQFGVFVSLDGDRVAVGAYGDDDNQGSAYIYDLVGSTWVGTAKLLAADGTADDNFGWSLSLDGDRLVVGASGQGAAYIFDINGGAWVESGKLIPSDHTAGDAFGFSVSLDNDHLVVGAPHADVSNGTNNQGAAYVFDFSNNDWSEIAKLSATDGVGGDFFGYAIFLDGNRFVVGAIYDDNRGSVYVFDFNNHAWNQSTKLIATDGADGAYFGHSLSLSDQHLAVGANGTNINGNINQGAIYVYTDDLIFKNGFEGN